MPRRPGDHDDPIAPVDGHTGAGRAGAASTDLAPGIDDAGPASGPLATTATSATAVDVTVGADGVHEVSSTTRANADAEIARALASGSLSQADAQQALIEQAIDAQLPEGATAADRELLRAELTALLAGDPTLERLLDPAK